MLGLLRRLGYGWIALYGVVAALLPGRAAALSTRLSLCGFENVEELDPKPWYLTAVRAAGVGMLAAGVTGLVLDGRDDEAEDLPVAIDAPESDTDD